MQPLLTKIWWACVDRASFIEQHLSIVRRPPMSNKPYFAEVVQSSLPFWTAQSWNWNEVIDFATLVIAEEKNRLVFGIVYAIETGSWQNERTPFPYQKTEEELLREQPHIFELLRTNFSCITVGYKEADQPITYQYAPQPPKIHRFVRPATMQETHDFFAHEHYIALLCASGSFFNLEELLLGMIQFRIKKGLFTSPHYGEFINALSLLMGNDYRRLKMFLYRLQPLINSNHPL